MMTEQDALIAVSKALPDAEISCTPSGICLWVDIRISDRFFTLQLTPEDGIGTSELTGGPRDAFTGHDAVYADIESALSFILQRLHGKSPTLPGPMRQFANLMLYGNILLSLGVWLVAPIYERYDRVNHPGSGMPPDDANPVLCVYSLIYAFAGILILMKRSRVALYFMGALTTLSVLRTQLLYVQHINLTDLGVIILRYWDVLILVLLRHRYVRPVTVKPND